MDLLITKSETIKSSLEQRLWDVLDPRSAGARPLTKFTLKSHALRNPEARDDAPLDLLAGLAARSPIDTLDATGIGEPRIYRCGLIRAGPAAFRASLACNITMRLVIRTTSANIGGFRWTGYDLML